MFGEVITHQHVKEVVLAEKVGPGQRHQLSLTSGHCAVSRAGQQLKIPREEGSSDEQGRIGGVVGPSEDFCRGGRVVTDEVEQERSVGWRHTHTVDVGTDGTLTATVQGLVP
ncbi:hypothetical protein NOCA2480006 [metagenome]|uniref:Uncharacterized protein n=1 Tax=metagenome TaxID=256318 RepID=A0A2P2C7E6_9ZZZZ